MHLRLVYGYGKRGGKRLLMTWRSHPTWFGFEHSNTEVRTLPTLLRVILVMVVDVKVFTIEKSYHLTLVF
jgi:hypothetical protein